VVDRGHGPLLFFVPARRGQIKAHDLVRLLAA
jgi:hypothetical protein